MLDLDLESEIESEKKEQGVEYFYQILRDTF